MTMRRMTKQQHKDIVGYVDYLRGVLRLTNFDIEVSEVILDKDDRYAEISTSAQKTRGYLSVSVDFFKDYVGDAEWKTDRTRTLCHEMTHVLLHGVTYMGSALNYSQFVPPAIIDDLENNFVCEVEKATDSISRILCQFVKPFEWTPEQVSENNDASTKVEGSHENP